MIDLLNKGYIPTMDEISDYIRNPVFDTFRRQLEGELGAKSALAYSSCSWMPGWNVKLRKAGKSLCTVYPREGFFTVLVVIGPAEKEAAEAILPECTEAIREIYTQTQEGSGQRWLMIDLEDADARFRDTLRLIRLRIPAKKKKL